MTIPVLIAISLMWVPVGFLFLGIGEAKATGAVTGFVGALVVVGAFLQAAVFKDPSPPGSSSPTGCSTARWPTHSWRASRTCVPWATSVSRRGS